MPAGERERQETQAKIMRASGESAILLTEVNNSSTIFAPFSLTATADMSANITYTRTTIYGKVTYDESMDERYDVGGVVTNSNAKLEASATRAPEMIAASAVLLKDGVTYKILKRNYSEGRESFVLTLASMTGPGVALR